MAPAASRDGGTGWLRSAHSGCAPPPRWWHWARGTDSCRREKRTASAWREGGLEYARKLAGSGPMLKRATDESSAQHQRLEEFGDEMIERRRTFERTHVPSCGDELEPRVRNAGGELAELGGLGERVFRTADDDRRNVERLQQGGGVGAVGHRLQCADHAFQWCGRHQFSQRLAQGRARGERR